MTTAAENRIDPATSIGAVGLTVGDVDRAQRFYEQAIGLETLDRSGDTARLGAGGDTLVELIGDPDAPPRPPGTSGLFHLAILVPDRVELARALRRVADAGWRFTGASDHLVSEALYLNDPEGNGIEIYRDRPREIWADKVDTTLTTMPLDVDDLLGALDDPATEPFDGLPAGTVMGHVHLKVAGIPEAIDFYRDILGFGLMAQLGEQAAFLSAGGYHHHVGANTWESAGASPAPSGTAALRHATIVLPDDDARADVVAEVEAAGRPVEDHGGDPLVRDPSGNALVLGVP
jgi:catechol 2,3-dioxygenase